MVFAGDYSSAHWLSAGWSFELLGNHRLGWQVEVDESLLWSLRAPLVWLPFLCISSSQGNTWYFPVSEFFVTVRKTFSELHPVTAHVSGLTALSWSRLSRA